MPSRTVRSNPKACFRCEMRPSDPVRHLMSERNFRLDSTERRVGPGRPFLGMATVVTSSETRASSTLASP